MSILIQVRSVRPPPVPRTTRVSSSPLLLLYASSIAPLTPLETRRHLPLLLLPGSPTPNPGYLTGTLAVGTTMIFLKLYSAMLLLCGERRSGAGRRAGKGAEETHASLPHTAP